MRHLSVTIGCATCDKTAPTHNNGPFMYIGIWPDENGHYYSSSRILGRIVAICPLCYRMGDNIGDDLRVFRQDTDGNIEVPDITVV